jgi:hypothetical protein
MAAVATDINMGEGRIDYGMATGFDMREGGIDKGVRVVMAAVIMPVMLMIPVVIPRIVVHFETSRWGRGNRVF